MLRLLLLCRGRRRRLSGRYGSLVLHVVHLVKPNELLFSAVTTTTNSFEIARRIVDDSDLNLSLYRSKHAR